MKTMNSLLIAVFLLFLCHSGYSNNSYFEKAKEVVIAGKVINIGQHQNHRTIQFIFRNILLDEQEKLTAEIDKNGNFKTKKITSYPQEFYLNYGKLKTLFCSPGDSLYLKIDADIFDDTRNENPNGQFFIREIKGTAAKINNDIIEYLAKLPDDKFIFRNAKNAVVSKKPEEYKTFIKQREKEYSEYLEKFLNNEKTNKLFIKWAKDRIKYGAWNDLMRYRWTHPHYNKIKRDSFHLPPSYFSFLNQYDMNDFDLITMSHGKFLHELSMYSREVPVDSLARAKKLFRDGRMIAGNQVFKNMIKYNTKGITGEVLFTNFYLLFIKSKHTDLFKSVYDSAFTDNAYILSTIEAEYNKLQNFMSNQDTKNANIETLSSGITVDLIDTIISRYKNKVIFIDFWAPWCGPCMKEMPYSKKIQKRFKEKDVIFLFLGSNCRKDSWKTTIANKELTGEHILLSDDQYNVLSSKLGISGIPHYTLIDKDGTIVMKDAPRPSNKDILINKIEKLLNSNEP